MKIHFLGAAQTVTGSQHLLEVDGRRLLLDCGLFQGKRAESFDINRNFAFNPSDLDAVIVSHAHIDHSGNLPNLVKKGYAGKIYTTDVSSHLMDIMLLDSAHIHESDAEYLNRKRKGREPEIVPLYTIADAAAACELFQGIPYNQPFEPIPGVTATLVEAGHILGSASVVLDVRENGRTIRLWYSGDIGRMRLPLVRDPVLPREADYLIMECTYGDKSHEDPEEAYDQLRDAVRKAVARGGKVIVPSFAVGRTQELVYNLHLMYEAGELPRIPVFVDSPLAVSVTDIFRGHQEFFDEEAWEFIREENKSPLRFQELKYIRSVEESKALNDRDEPMIIISASGMAESGRILHHLKNNIGDRRNLILIVSYQAPHTLGRRLADGEMSVRIFGEWYERRAEVIQIDGFSAHAGQDFLVDYALASRQSLKGVFLVHGEAGPAQLLIDKLGARGLKNVFYPKKMKVVELGVRK